MPDQREADGESRDEVRDEGTDRVGIRLDVDRLPVLVRRLLEDPSLAVLDELIDLRPVLVLFVCERVRLAFALLLAVDLPSSNHDFPPVEPSHEFRTLRVDERGRLDQHHSILGLRELLRLPGKRWDQWSQRVEATHDLINLVELDRPEGSGMEARKVGHGERIRYCTFTFAVSARPNGAAVPMRPIAYSPARSLRNG